MPDGVLHAPARFKEACEIVMTVLMVGITLQRLLIHCNRLSSTILILQEHAEIEAQSCARFARRDSLAVHTLGRLPLARQVKKAAVIDVRLEMLRIRRDDPLITLLRRNAV